MAVLEIEQYRQKNGNDVLKVIIKPTKAFPEGGYFYCDSCDEELVRQYTWYLRTQKQPYVVAYYMDMGRLYFHREKAYNISDKYPDYINHVNGIEFDNINCYFSHPRQIWA